MWQKETESEDLQKCGTRVWNHISELEKSWKLNTHNFKGADPSCVFSFPVTDWRGTWKIGDDRGQQGGGRVPPIGQINTLHFLLSWQRNKSQAGTGWCLTHSQCKEAGEPCRVNTWVKYWMCASSSTQKHTLPIITSATETGRPHNLSTVPWPSSQCRSSLVLNMSLTPAVPQPAPLKWVC